MPLDDGLGHQRGGGFPLADQPVDDFLVLLGILGIVAVLVVSGTAHKVRSLAADAGIRPIGYAVAIHVQVAVEGLRGLQFLGVEHLAVIGPVTVVPLKFVAHPVVHADVQIEHHDHRGLQPIRQVECRHGQIKAFVGI